jgi:hypothetical protein
MVHMLLLGAAAIMFLLAAVQVPSRIALVPLGLLFWVLTLIV